MEANAAGIWCGWRTCADWGIIGGVGGTWAAQKKGQRTSVSTQSIRRGHPAWASSIQQRHWWDKTRSPTETLSSPRRHPPPPLPPAFLYSSCINQLHRFSHFQAVKSLFYSILPGGTVTENLCIASEISIASGAFLLLLPFHRIRFNLFFFFFHQINHGHPFFKKYSIWFDYCTSLLLINQSVSNFDSWSQTLSTLLSAIENGYPKKKPTQIVEINQIHWCLSLLLIRPSIFDFWHFADDFIDCLCCTKFYCR